MLIRLMAEPDLQPVAGIEQESISGWNLAQIAKELQESSGVQLVVEADDGEVVGWCCGRTVGVEAELFKIVVRKRYRRQGIAGKLLERYESVLAQHGVRVVYLEVRSRNHPAMELYRMHGYQPAGCRRNYYTDPEDDALVMKKVFKGFAV